MSFLLHFSSFLIGGNVPVDDGVDKLNRKYTILILVCLSLPLVTKQFAGEPIECFTPTYFTEPQARYVNSYCWTASTYYIIPVDEDERSMVTRVHSVTFDEGGSTKVKGERIKVNYYQWAPIILLVEAGLFYIPFAIWNATAKNSGIKVGRLLKKVSVISQYTPGHPDRDALITEFLDQFNTLMGAAKCCPGTICKFDCSASCASAPSCSLFVLYMFIKLLYVLNILVQYFLLTAFLGDGYLFHGIEVLEKLINRKEWWTSPRFPLQTLCQVLAANQGALRTYTCQCVLPINLFNEKIFSFIWFFFAFLLPITIYSGLIWIWRTLACSRIAFVHYYLWRTHRIGKEDLYSSARKMAVEYLGWDGCLVLRLVEMNHGGTILTTLTERLWEFYEGMERTQEDGGDTEQFISQRQPLYSCGPVPPAGASSVPGGPASAPFRFYGRHFLPGAPGTYPGYIWNPGEIGSPSFSSYPRIRGKIRTEARCDRALGRSACTAPAGWGTTPSAASRDLAKRFSNSSNDEVNNTTATTTSTLRSNSNIYDCEKQDLSQSSLLNNTTDTINSNQLSLNVVKKSSSKILGVSNICDISQPSLQGQLQHPSKTTRQKQANKKRMLAQQDRENAKRKSSDGVDIMEIMQSNLSPTSLTSYSQELAYGASYGEFKEILLEAETSSVCSAACTAASTSVQRHVEKFPTAGLSLSSVSEDSVHQSEERTNILLMESLQTRSKDKNRSLQGTDEKYGCLSNMGDISKEEFRKTECKLPEVTISSSLMSLQSKNTSNNTRKNVAFESNACNSSSAEGKASADLNVQINTISEFRRLIPNHRKQPGVSKCTDSIRMEEIPTGISKATKQDSSNFPGITTEEEMKKREFCALSACDSTSVTKATRHELISSECVLPSRGILIDPFQFAVKERFPEKDVSQLRQQTEKRASYSKNKSLSRCISSSSAGNVELFNRFDIANKKKIGPMEVFFGAKTKFTLSVADGLPEDSNCEHREEEISLLTPVDDRFRLLVPEEQTSLLMAIDSPKSSTTDSDEFMTQTSNFEGKNCSLLTRECLNIDNV